MIKKLLFVSSVVLGLAGCATPIKVSLTEKFDSAAAAEMLKPGPNTIKGSALIRQNGGGVVTCAGNQITLFPATWYAKQRLAVLYGNAERAYRSASGPLHNYVFDPDPASFSTLLRTTTCDAQGYFAFNSVADGEFLVISRIIWNVGGPQGGWLLQHVTVKGGETREIVLSP